MKHLPNLLTLGNLFSGCIAIAFILNAQNFLVPTASQLCTEYTPVISAPQMLYGSLFIGIAAICDLLDGLAARALNVHSPIGKDLDSLADLVSFGVAPSMILFKLLWASHMMDIGALDVPMLLMAPAFLVACFAALRLAKFNTLPPQKTPGFIGMPTPAAGIFIATLPIVFYSNPYHLGAYLQNKWVLYIIIALVCWLMVSRIPFIKLMPYKWKLPFFWPQLIIVAGTLAALPFLGLTAFALGFVLYILLSLVYRAPEIPENSAA